MNRRVRILGKGLYSSNVKDVAGIEGCSYFLIFHTFFYKISPRTRVNPSIRNVTAIKFDEFE